MKRDEAKMRRGILFLIEEVRRLVVNDADANEVLEILEELEASTKTRLRSCACGGREPIVECRGTAGEWVPDGSKYFEIERVPDGWHLMTFLAPSPFVKDPFPVRVIILAEPQGE